MIYEVEFSVESRHIGRIIAKQLCELHLCYYAKVTQCDMTFVLNNEVAERTACIVVALTTKPKAILALSNTIKNDTIPVPISNIIISERKVLEETERLVTAWCGTEENTTNVDTEVGSESSSKSSLSDTAEPEKSAVPNRARRKAKEAVTSDTTEETPVKKKRAQMPKWAVEQNLTASEYSALRDWKVAARWGMSYPEYSRASADARKIGMPLKKYLERIGKTHNPDLDVSFVTLDYIKAQRQQSAKEENIDNETTETN